MASRAVRIILGVVGSLLVLVVILVGVGLYLAGSFVQKVADEIRTDTLTTIRPRTTAEHVEFALTYGKDVTNLANFTVSDSQGNRLWELDCRGSGKPAVIVYGALPAGPPREYVQKFPLDDSQPAEIRGTRVRVVINVRYNIAFGPGHELHRAELDIPNAP